MTYVGNIYVQQTRKLFIDKSRMSIFPTGLGGRYSGNLPDMHGLEESCVGRDVCYRIMLDTTVCLSDRKLTKPTVKYRTHGKTYRLYPIHLFQFLIERKQRKGAISYFYCIFVMVCTGFD